MPWGDIEEFGGYVTAQATDQGRTESRRDAGSEGSGNSKADNGRREQCRLLLVDDGLCTGTTSRSIGPGALCDYGSYQKRLKLQIVPVAGAPVLSVGVNTEEGTIGYLGTANGTRNRPLSNNGNHWSPVFLAGAKRGKIPEWCGALNVGVENFRELEENWVDKCAEAGQLDDVREVFVNVDQVRYESEISANASMGHGKPLGFNPNGTVGF